MEQIVYGDVLFLINFSMDFLTLFITAKLQGRRLRPLRLTLAAALGALYGVAACFMAPPLWVSVAINVAVSFLMCYIAFDDRLLSSCALFYGCGCLLGGAMTALYHRLGSVEGTETLWADGGYQTAGSDIPLGWMAVVAILIGGASILVGRMTKSKGRAFEVSLTVTVEETTLSLTGLCDSGNLLCDPLTKQPVILLCDKAARSLFPPPLFEAMSKDELPEADTLPPPLRSRLRLIPCHALGFEGLLLAYRPDLLTIDGTEQTALISFRRDTASFDGRDALVPSSLI